MRNITDHQINECNQAITITADDPDEKYGGASNVYECAIQGAAVPGGDAVIRFQRGPIKEVGTNGLTHEVLLAILVDRLRGFQSGPFACRENALALAKLEEAQHWLHNRTRARVARGVEGTYVK